jgi:hypothetical protein
MTPRLQIRPRRYRDRDGFSVTGRDTLGRRVSVFAGTRAAAEHIREVIRAGKPVTLRDFNPTTED